MTPPARPRDNPGMDEKPMKRGGGTAVVLVLVAVLVVLPMLYVLSTGPVVWMAHSGFISESLIPVIGVIYAPLEWVAHNVPVVGPALDQYVEWWQPANSVPTPPAGS